MPATTFLLRFAVTFAVTLVVNAAVVYLWNLLRHGAGAFDWGTPLALAVAVGTALSTQELWARRA